jgi:hypothetical protein
MWCCGVIACCLFHPGVSRVIKYGSRTNLIAYLVLIVWQFFCKHGIAFCSVEIMNSAMPIISRIYCNHGSVNQTKIPINHASVCRYRLWFHLKSAAREVYVIYTPQWLFDGSFKTIYFKILFSVISSSLLSVPVMVFNGVSHLSSTPSKISQTSGKQNIGPAVYYRMRGSLSFHYSP